MHNSHTNSLFARSELRVYMDGKIAEATNEAAALDLDVFEANSDEQIVNHIISNKVIAPINLKVENAERSLEETSVDAWNYPNRMLFDDSPRPFPIPGYKIEATIPFEGSPELFELRPSTYIMTTVRGQLSYQNKTITVTFELPQDTATEDAISQAIDQNIATIQKMIEYVNQDLAGYSDNLRTQTEAAVQRRKESLDKMNNLKKALRIPIEKREQASPVNQVKITVNKIEPLAQKKDEPGAEISDDDYEAVLSSIRSMGASMETSRASESQDEETLRDVLLVGLNASIKTGNAGGELFRKNGKTDISIPFENKAAFIAECKLWKGKSYIQDGITQILGYTTWRDAKTAIVIFNKDNQDFSKIQDQMDSVFTEHEAYVRSADAKKGEWRYIFHKPDDKGRLIKIHVFLFDVYRSARPD